MSDPNFSYLRMVIDGRVVILARGEIENESGGLVEGWYSTDRATLRLRDGRVAGVFGFTSEWRRVVQPDAPSWREAARAVAPLHWLRVRDVMPGYSIGVRDAMSLQRIAPPGDSALVGVEPKSLVWFEETMDSGVLPPARYAVDLGGERENVVYGEQCLSVKLCLSWQRWAATPSFK
ncbi:MAG: YjbF family lipoprotein [Nitrosomonadales bacterium]|nr:YjbF family lipoprotein [Nitrosomonadales bacterium]